MTEAQLPARGWFVPYQVRWLAEQARMACALKSRRIGFSEVEAFGTASRAAGIDVIRGTRVAPANQNIVSASEPQAKRFVARVARHLEAFGHVGLAVLEGEPGKSEIRLRNGCTVTAFSCSARTIRGESGDVVLEEFGAMRNPDEVWAAVQPIAAPNLGNPNGYRIRIIGTPLGDAGRFWRLCRGDLRHTVALHEVSIHDAVRDGFPADVAALREEMGDDDLFAQEYELSFLSADARYISSGLYDSAVYEALTDFEGVALGTLGNAGMDVARTAHRSAIAELQNDAQQVAWVRSVESRRDVPWDEQERWVDEVLQRNANIAIDSTGIGNQFAERLAAKHGGRVLPVTFTLGTKELLATGLKLAFERRRLRVPDDPELRRAVLSIRKQITKSGNVVFGAEAGKHGHADEGWALALAIHANGGAVFGGIGAGRIYTGADLLRQRLGSVGAYRKDGVWYHPLGRPLDHLDGFSESEFDKLPGGYLRPRRGGWR